MKLTAPTWLAGLGLALATALPVQADQAEEIQKIISALAPMQQESTAPAQEASRGVQIGNRTVWVVPQHSIDLQVFFALDSYELTWRAREDLAALGHALASSALRPHRYLIAGHTDVSGDDAYNQWLSERRAESVARYLVQNFPIDPARLIAVGFGETRLKTPQTPTAAINRRVEVTLLLPARPEAAAPAAPAATTTPPPAESIVPAPQPETPLPGTLQKDKDGNITITW
ncbi:OmpA family protein [Mameliella sediminis]|uniref:OmpA family protein n=1 Tax=Mameliella sediminis TaxID=2836866 RepID=UPI001C483146|nr:OmpA family protein [Mameliella sediminis]MBY6114786.1 OmpA family protein [Antarctobacter heliothermus]MBY6144359.1 OmpA family protein [Mameliella alba]MBV7392733.1 OmpA family protein [Mameliella sediminis]MBY6161350.1 OmpA family protein [Mameliella alba]MBY6170184.1 OmpA family protein [Mameliella alba]